MRAVVCPRYGPPDVLELRDDVAPPSPGEDGVVVRVRAAALNPLDWHFVRGEPVLGRIAFGLRAPKRRVPGADVAGRVEAVGAAVTRFRPGDEVFGTAAGALAELARGTERTLAPKPPGLTFEQAAAIPVAGLTALQSLRDEGRLRAGQRVLVNGASGGVGTFAVQVARALGADVTGVCSARNAALVRSLGATRVLDYATEDFTRGEECYDLILDIVGTRTLSDTARALAPGGTAVLIGAPSGRWLAPVPRLLAATLRARLGGPRLVPFLARIRSEDLATLAGLIDAGKVTPVIDRAVPLREAAEGLCYLEAGHARGKVVVTLDGSAAAG